MNWVRAIAGVLVLWAGTAWGSSLTWTANSEPDLAGYRVYKCNQQPCTLTSGILLVILGTATSYYIGTPAVIQYYFITAYDFGNNESLQSSLATFTPAGAPPPPPLSPSLIGTVSLTVVGNPATGPWGVKGSTTNPQDVMAAVSLDGAMHHIENHAPYGFPGDNGTTVTTGLFGTGMHTVEFVFSLQDTATEIGRASITVQEESPPPSPSPMGAVSLMVGTVSLTFVGNPATGPWGVKGSTTNTQDVMAAVRLDGAMHHVENHAPYSFPGDNGRTVTPGLFGSGSHTVEFVFYLQGTTTEIGRASVTVQEGSLG